jgi:hypothetical protein
MRTIKIVGRNHILSIIQGMELRLLFYKILQYMTPKHSYYGILDKTIMDYLFCNGGKRLAMNILVKENVRPSN